MRMELRRRQQAEEASPGFIDGLLGAAVSASTVFTEAAVGVFDAFGQVFNSLVPASLSRESIANVPTGTNAEGESANGEELMQTGRQFLQAGSVYQNAYMCIWNDCGVPVSAMMRMLDGDEYVLQVTHLDSKDRDSVGWIELRGSIELQPVPDAPHRMSVILKSSDPANAFTYDDKVFTRGANFALGCIKRVSSAVLSAFRIEVDMRTDVVSVHPKAAPLRMFWTTPVALEPTSEQDLWKPHSIKEGYKGPLPGVCMHPGAQAAEQVGHVGGGAGTLAVA